MSQPWTHSAPGAKAYERSNEHYVEPEWVSMRLFDEEPFEGAVYDPCCGFGRIVCAALKHKLKAYGSDIADRGWDSTPQDFFQHTSTHDNIVANPPFDVIRAFALSAIGLTRNKTALIMPTARLNAARWLEQTPLRRIWLLTPRPSMPPGSHIMAGGKIGGGKSDYCWLVWQRGYGGTPEVKWLRRDDGGKVDRQDNSAG
jgi:hypothetical protein